MSLENVVLNRDKLLLTIGKNAMNIKYPKEFELYLCALELTDQNFKTLRYFVFPIMPSSMDEGKPQPVSVLRTLGGITTNESPTFTPTDISISGNFGRKFKILLGTDYVDFVSSFTAPGGGITGKSFNAGVKEMFDDRVKSGYGCLKIMEEIIEQSRQIGEDGQLRKLIWHNPALGNSYLVKGQNVRLTMTEQTNMVWGYNLQMKSIAPLESLLTTQELESVAKRLNITGYIQKKVDTLLNNITALIATNEQRLPAHP